MSAKDLDGNIVSHPVNCPYRYTMGNAYCQLKCSLVPCDNDDEFSNDCPLVREKCKFCKWNVEEEYYECTNPKFGCFCEYVESEFKYCHGYEPKEKTK